MVAISCEAVDLNVLDALARTSLAKWPRFGLRACTAPVDVGSFVQGKGGGNKGKSSKGYGSAGPSSSSSPCHGCGKLLIGLGIVGNVIKQLAKARAKVLQHMRKVEGQGALCWDCVRMKVLDVRVNESHVSSVSQY